MASRSFIHRSRLEGRIDPGRVFDCEVGLDGAPDGCRAMNESDSITVMVKP